ncbi:MAG TPA: multicopper oxidase domain-containing protein [Gemmatimonadales bacterium]|jgi:FtsP/CotA-like multicopper oxidase with cupredoxin domain|nr:multicopper oxidase domain-containing protein [Gemmatimonadales bacterium]
MPRSSFAPLAFVCLLLGSSAAAPRTQQLEVLANPNRNSAGVLANGVLTIHLEAVAGLWHPDADSGPGLSVLVFREEGHLAQDPGPLIRVPEGTEIRASIRNSLTATTLIIHGLHTRPAEGDDTLQVASGAVREVRFAAGAPGSYFYWATTSNSSISRRLGPDSQLSGAFIVDPKSPDSRAKERILLITVAQRPGAAANPGDEDRIFAINGKSWPYTERLSYTAGDSIRFRLINASAALHPMHLHGFYYRVERRGNAERETRYPPEQQRLAVTELMLQGTTMTLAWSPDRPGNWVFHCHMAAHISSALRLSPESHPDNHLLEGMAGLIVGLRVEPRPGTPQAPPEPARRQLRLLARTAPGRYGSFPGLGFILQQGTSEPAPDSVPLPGSPILLTRGEPTAITVVNRTSAPISVHWHGIELESYFDGVGGWSGDPGHLAPAIAPNDSFVVRLTPRRAGTFIYHTHADELQQLASGLYGPLIVLEPGQALDTVTDRVMLLSRAGPSPDAPILLNGIPGSVPLEFRAGVRYRLRFINIAASSPFSFRLVADSTVLAWRAVGKDGYELPPAQAVPVAAQLRMGAGETYDFEFIPPVPGELRLELQAGRGLPLTPILLTIPVHVH